MKLYPRVILWGVLTGLAAGVLFAVVTGDRQSAANVTGVVGALTGVFLMARQNRRSL